MNRIEDDIAWGDKLMTEEVHQQLSAAIDDEVRGSRTRFLVSRLLSDRELCARWERYQLAGEVLRGTLAGSRWSPDFSAGVMARLETESAHRRAPAARRRQLFASGLAAAIAGVVLVGAVQWLDADLIPTGPFTGQIQTAGQSGAGGLPGQLEAYLAGHQELMAISGGHGMVPYARLASEFRDAGEQE